MANPSDQPVPFDRIADRYDETRGGARRGEEMAGELVGWLAPGRVLEVCVGTGVVSAALAARGVAVCGLDISAPMLARAHQRLGSRVIQGDARRLPVADASVDNVLFVWALHLVGDLRAALAEAARVVRPGGRIVAVHAGPHSGHPELATAMAPLKPVRFARRPDTLDAVTRAAERAGLRVVHAGLVIGGELSATPAGTIAEIESRVWSFLWQVDDAEWREHVTPTIAALRALPDQDRPRRFHSPHQLTVFAAADAG